MEFNKVGYRTWPDNCADQTTTYVWLALFVPLSLCFPTLTQIHPFPYLWFLLKHPIEDIVQSHNVSLPLGP